MPNPRLSNAVLWLAIIGLSFFLVERFAVITELLAGPLLMFGFAWLIAIVIEPIFLWAAHAKIPRMVSVPVIYVLLLSLIIFAVVAIIPIVATQIQGLIIASPQLTSVFWATLDDLQTQLRKVGVNSDIKTYFNADTFLSQAGIFGREAFSQTLGAASSIAIVIFDLFVVLILSFYMAFDGQKAFDKLVRLSPNGWREEVQTFGNIISNTFGGYMRVQIVSSIIYALTNAVVMWSFGLNSITLTTVIVSIIVMVPVIGGVIALIPPIMVILIAGATGTIVPFFVIMLIIQQILFSVILPRMVGRIVGLHPLLVFAALLIGARVAGPYGILFGTPLAGVAASIANYFYMRTQTITEPIPVPTDSAEHVDLPG